MRFAGGLVGLGVDELFGTDISSGLGALGADKAMGGVSGLVGGLLGGDDMLGGVVDAAISGDAGNILSGLLGGLAQEFGVVGPGDVEAGYDLFMNEQESDLGSGLSVLKGGGLLSSNVYGGRNGKDFYGGSGNYKGVDGGVVDYFGGGSDTQMGGYGFSGAGSMLGKSVI